MSRKVLLIALTLFSLLIPNALAITFDGIEFQSATGGVIKFGSSFAAAQFAWVSGMNVFTGFTWSGVNMGGLRFDADSGVNMTITHVTTSSVRYTVNTGIGGNVKTYVRYGKYDAGPGSFTGASTVITNPATSVSSMTTVGNGVVVQLNYAETSTLIVSQAIQIAGFLVIAFLAGLQNHYTHGSKIGELMVILALSTYLLLVIANMIQGMGF